MAARCCQQKLRTTRQKRNRFAFAAGPAHLAAAAQDLHYQWGTTKPPEEHPMATKAQNFRREEERKVKRDPARVRPHEKRSKTDAGAQNLSERAGRKALVTTEESLSGKPSRKASRSSSHHGKNSSVLEYVERMKVATPQFRHQRRSR